MSSERELADVQCSLKETPNGYDFLVSLSTFQKGSFFHGDEQLLAGSGEAYCALGGEL